MQAPTQEVVSPRTMLVGGIVCALLEAAACADDGNLVGTESASTTEGTSTSQETTDTQNGSISETSSVPAGWPQDWYGAYYAEPGFPLGVELQGKGLFIDGFRNMRLEEDTVTIEQFTYAVGEGEYDWVFTIERNGGTLRVLPPDGEWDVLYPGAEEVVVRPGPECDEIALEVRGQPSPYDPMYSTRWWRGSLCLIDPYDESIANDKWMIDLCPGSVSSCDGG
jgi:hypothetical protein